MGPGFYPPGPPGGPYPPPQGGYPYQGYPQYGWQGGPQEPPKTTGSESLTYQQNYRNYPSLPNDQIKQVLLFQFVFSLPSYEKSKRIKSTVFTMEFGL
ncbi:hypothetical protein E5288_WYG005413 [Bos mutus]|uniref:Cysteine-rich and transmembrane domain-containing protein 1 n=1 Tax=Bos mutus TaxID=72004 RepID=A0A6B0RN77_9CETA|nr:hypothetical protein [Bos mutus]